MIVVSKNSSNPSQISHGSSHVIFVGDVGVLFYDYEKQDGGIALRSQSPGGPRRPPRGILVPRFWFEKPKKPNLIKGGAAAITVIRWQALIEGLRALVAAYSAAELEPHAADRFRRGEEFGSTARSNLARPQRLSRGPDRGRPLFP